MKTNVLTLAGWNGLTAQQICPAAISMTNDMQHCRLGVSESIARLTNNLNAAASCEVRPVRHIIIQPTAMHTAVPNLGLLAYYKQQRK